MGLAALRGRRGGGARPAHLRRRLRHGDGGRPFGDVPIVSLSPEREWFTFVWLRFWGSSRGGTMRRRLVFFIAASAAAGGVWLLPAAHAATEGAGGLCPPIGNDGAAKQIVVP